MVLFDDVLRVRGGLLVSERLYVNLSDPLVLTTEIDFFPVWFEHQIGFKIEISVKKLSTAWTKTLRALQQ